MYLIKPKYTSKCLNNNQHYNQKRNNNMLKCKTNVSDKQQRNKDTVYFAKYYMIRKSAARYRIACILHVEYCFFGHAFNLFFVHTYNICMETIKQHNHYIYAANDGLFWNRKSHTRNTFTCNHMYFMCVKQAYMRRECAGSSVQYTGGWTVRLPTSSLFHIFEYL